MCLVVSPRGVANLGGGGVATAYDFFISVSIYLVSKYISVQRKSSGVTALIYPLIYLVASANGKQAVHVVNLKLNTVYCPAPH